MLLKTRVRKHVDLSLVASPVGHQRAKEEEEEEEGAKAEEEVQRMVWSSAAPAARPI